MYLMRLLLLVLYLCCAACLADELESKAIPPKKPHKLESKKLDSSVEVDCRAENNACNDKGLD